MKSIVVLISGQGSNLAALIEACRRETWPASIAAVISNRPDAGGLNRARAAGIAAEVLDPQQFSHRLAFDEALAARIDHYRADLVVLAGFMRILSEPFVARYFGRLMNIHPSLLPAFTGLHTHRQALAAGVKVHGATVHFVTPQLDAGPIIAQAALAVLPGDDEARLAARVLQLEHQLYPRAVRWFVEDRLTLLEGRVQLLGHAEPMQLGLSA